jgi:GTP-binding protein
MRFCGRHASSSPLELHRINFMKLDAEFETSVFSLAGCPRWNRAEVALAGRSNVGKSSLLNALTGIKGLARTSKTPGRTQSINLFAVGQSLALADLPGYGYAKMPEAIAQRIASSMSEYLRERENLAALVMLIDSRRGPGREELELAEIIRARDLVLIVVATKIDKLKRSERAKAVATFKPLSLEPILCSVTDGEGIDELRRRILKLAR